MTRKVEGNKTKLLPIVSIELFFISYFLFLWLKIEFFLFMTVDNAPVNDANQFLFLRLKEQQKGQDCACFAPTSIFMCK